MIAADTSAPKGIVWIASYPRSGDTWLRIFLHHLIRIKRGLPVEGREIDRIDDTSPSIAGHAELFARIMGKPLVEANMQDVVLARPQVAAEMAHLAAGVLPVQTHSLLGRIFDVPLINLGVSVGAVYVVRNPLDVVISLADYLSKPIDGAITSMGAHLNATPTKERLVAEIWGSWSENVRSWTTNPPPVIKVVRYEDLSEDPIANFTAVADHMRIGATPAEIEEAVRLASFDAVTKEDEGGGLVKRPAWIDRTGQWKQRLTPEQVERIVADHREQMARFGYLPA